MTHLLNDYDNIGESVAWCGADIAWQCSEEPDDVDCVRCLEAYLDYGKRVQVRLDALLWSLAGNSPK